MRNVFPNLYEFKVCKTRIYEFNGSKRKWILRCYKRFLSYELTGNKTDDLTILFNCFQKNNEEKEVAGIIHYLLQYISLLQNFEVIWVIEENTSPLFTYNKTFPDKIDALITKKEIDIDTFNLVLKTALDLKEERERERWLS